MFHIPTTFLNKLKCHFCDGYLNAEPVVVKDGKQICAKCYNILPKEEKDRCIREISFEAIANCLIFPCRYHQMGCDYKFAWNSGSQHESVCNKRHFTVPDLVATSRISNPVPVPEYSSIVKIEKTESLVLEENNNNLDNSNIHSTIKCKRALLCLSCNMEVDKLTKNECLFGHISCFNCKSDMCIACVKNLDGTCTIACKNASKGCQELLHQGDVDFHIDNCEFKEITCPFHQCEVNHSLPLLITHLKQDHANKIVLSPEIRKSMMEEDQTFVILCYGGIFKCVYYYFSSWVEIMVIYLGPCIKALEFYFEVAVEVKRRSIRKKLGCDWNNDILAKGVKFDKKELHIGVDQPLKFEMNLKIYRVNNS